MCFEGLAKLSRRVWRHFVRVSREISLGSSLHRASTDALISLSVTKCCKFTHIKNVNKTCTFLNFDPVGGRHGGIYIPENTHATSEVVRGVRHERKSRTLSLKSIWKSLDIFGNQVEIKIRNQRFLEPRMRRPTE